MTKPTLEDLQKRVEQYFTLSLPGQPRAVHAGTLQLVTDLWERIRDLEGELAKADAKVKTLEARLSYECKRANLFSNQVRDLRVDLAQSQSDVERLTAGWAGEIENLAKERERVRTLTAQLKQERGIEKSYIATKNAIIEG